MKIASNNISQEELKLIKESFYHIYHSFLDDGSISKDIVGCLFKWGIQLHLSESELKFISPEYHKDAVTDKDAGLSHIFNMVYMVYLDGTVEDIELEVVTRFAEKLGFQSYIVNDLLKTIVTAPYDGYDFLQMKDQLKELLEDSRNS